MPFLDKPSPALDAAQGAQIPKPDAPAPPEVKDVLATDFFKRQVDG
jgi:hypothetical protein